MTSHFLTKYNISLSLTQFWQNNISTYFLFSYYAQKLLKFFNIILLNSDWDISQGQKKNSEFDCAFFLYNVFKNKIFKILKRVHCVFILKQNLI